ncbi:hypothetical protein OH787_06325 [Streptomyces sp. NBC_01547]|uniref:hypothetical protein n=1 Tax=Streptomyces sp. NBC_01547 TaxID=2975873 RepID=UPI00386B114D
MAVVQAASTDAWTTAREAFSRMLGGGDLDRQAIVERRLDETWTALEGARVSELDEVRREQRSRWTVRLQDFLEEDPASATSLRELLRVLSAADARISADGSDFMAVGGDQINVATSGGVAAGYIRGQVSTTGDPRVPGPDLT